MEIITTHINADFDCLGGMIAAKKLYPRAEMVFSGAQERNLREFFLHSSGYAYGFKRLREVDFDRVTRLILVDVSQPERIGPFAEVARRPEVELHVYDHHPASPSGRKPSVEVVRPVGSTVTVFCELFQERGIHPDPDEATMMMLGLYEDTGSLQFNSTTVNDYQAAAFLLQHGASLNTVADFLTQELTADQVALLHQLLGNLQTVQVNGVPVSIAHATTSHYVGDVAVLAHKIKDMENLDALIVVVRMGDRIFLVGRSRIPEVHVGEILEEFHGGGHSFAAAASLRDLTLPQLLEEIPKVLAMHVRPSVRARDLMSTPVRSIPADATLAEARQEMIRFNVNALPVIEAEGVVGLITRQLADRATHHGLGEEAVADYMEEDLNLVEPEATLPQLQDLLVEKQQRFLPVVAQGRLVGALTRTDLLRHLVSAGAAKGGMPGAKGRISGLWLKKKRITRFMEERLPERLRKILRNLGQTGADLEMEVYLVGGFVRDLLLRQLNLDVDVVVEGDGIAFATVFARNHGCRVRSHAKFGTAVLIFPDGFKIDVASSRTEFYQQPAALPLVESASLKLDLFRRDFTINTLAIALNPTGYGMLLDYFGGQRDLKDHAVRVLHNLSFVEDPTRVFRAVRFEQRLAFQMGKPTEQLLRNAVRNGFVERVGGYRLFHELELILREADPWPAVKRMANLELLKYLHPCIACDEALEQLFAAASKAIHWYELLFASEPCASWKVYLLCLVSGLDRTEIEELCRRLAIPPRVGELLGAEQVLARQALQTLHAARRGGDLLPSELHGLLQPLSTESLLFLLASAGTDRVRRCLSQFVTQWRDVTVAIDGGDLRRLGIPPGPIYKKIFQEVLAARLDGRVTSREEELALAAEQFGAPAPAGPGGNASGVLTGCERR